MNKISAKLKNRIKKVVEFQINDPLLKRYGGTEDFIHLITKDGNVITNPFLNEDGTVEVSPLEYYSEAFLDSKFMKLTTSLERIPYNDNYDVSIYHHVLDEEGEFLVPRAKVSPSNYICNDSVLDYMFLTDENNSFVGVVLEDCPVRNYKDLIESELAQLAFCVC